MKLVCILLISLLLLGLNPMGCFALAETGSLPAVYHLLLTDYPDSYGGSVALHPIADYCVYVGEDAGESENYAADEFIASLRAATGIELEKTTTYDPDNGHYVIIGRANEVGADLADKPDMEILGEDGFELRPSAGNLLIAGATDRGTLYGVYQYLRHYLGFEWYARDTQKIPRLRRDELLPLPMQSRAHWPRFRYRCVFVPEAGEPTSEMGAGPEDGDFAARIQLNGQLNSTADDIKRDQESGDPLFFHSGLLYPKHGFGINVLTAYNIDINSGIADTTFNSALEGVRILAEHRFFPGQEPRTGLWYPRIEHRDGSERNSDPADEALISANGGAEGAPLMHLTSRVANAYASEDPQALILGEAYLWSLKPPTNISLPANAGISFAPIEADWGKSLNSPTNSLFSGYLEEWKAHTDHIWAWLYTTNFNGYLQPQPTLYPMMTTIKHAAANKKVEGIFLQDSYTTKAGSFAALHTWVYSRLLWNPDLDGDQLVREFCENYYGKAGGVMYDYIRDLHTEGEKTGSFIGTKSIPTSPYLNVGFLIRTDQAMQQAEQLAAADEQALRHIKTERLGIDWIMLINNARLKQQALDQGLPWPDMTDSQRTARFDRFSANVEAAEIEDFGEDTGELEMVLGNVGNPRVLPTEPLHCASGDGCVDYQDMSFMLSGAEFLHADNEASDYSAARMDGSETAWGIQAPLQYLLPKTGSWDIYATVKIEAGTDPDPDATAMSGGVSDTGNEQDILLKALADEKYHIIRMPGGPYTYSKDRDVWFAPPGSDTISDMYVDRVYAVPHADPVTQSWCPAGSGFSSCRLLRETGLELFMESSSLVADESAEDGFAAFMPQGVPGWYIQGQLKYLLPDSGSWNVYASVRIRKIEEVPATETAFVMGIGEENRAVQVSELEDEQYHLLSLPGSDYPGGAEDTIYFTNTNDKITLYVDYLLAVEN